MVHILSTHSGFMRHFHPYVSGSFYWHWGNHMIAPVPVKWSGKITGEFSQYQMTRNDKIANICIILGFVLYASHILYITHTTTAVLDKCLASTGSANPIKRSFPCQVSTTYAKINQHMLAYYEQYTDICLREHIITYDYSFITHICKALHLEYVASNQNIARHCI